MLERTRRFLKRFHEDESGPNTVEWVLLIVVGLVILIAIYLVVTLMMDRMRSETNNVVNNNFE